MAKHEKVRVVRPGSVPRQTKAELRRLGKPRHRTLDKEIAAQIAEAREQGRKQGALAMAALFARAIQVTAATSGVGPELEKVGELMRDLVHGAEATDADL